MQTIVFEVNSDNTWGHKLPNQRMVYPESCQRLAGGSPVVVTAVCGGEAI